MESADDAIFALFSLVSGVFGGRPRPRLDEGGGVLGTFASSVVVAATSAGTRCFFDEDAFSFGGALRLLADLILSLFVSSPSATSSYSPYKFGLAFELRAMVPLDHCLCAQPKSTFARK